MLVKDLIHLLQTRGDPDHKVFVTFIAKNNDESFQHFIEIGDSFGSVWTEDEQDACVIKGFKITSDDPDHKEKAAENEDVTNELNIILKSLSEKAHQIIRILQTDPDHKEKEKHIPLFV